MLILTQCYLPFDDIGSSSLFSIENEIIMKLVSLDTFAPSRDILTLIFRSGSAMSIFSGQSKEKINIVYNKKPKSVTTVNLFNSQKLRDRS